jgi:hypothetical protein
MAAASASSSSKKADDVVEKTADEVAAELVKAERELSRPQRLAQKVYECGLPDRIVPADKKRTLKKEILEEIEAHGETAGGAERCGCSDRSLTKLALSQTCPCSTTTFAASWGGQSMQRC